LCVVDCKEKIELVDGNVGYQDKLILKKLDHNQEKYQIHMVQYKVVHDNVDYHLEHLNSSLIRERKRTELEPEKPGSIRSLVWNNFLVVKLPLFI
jgi:hypothetical protein